MNRISHCTLMLVAALGVGAFGIVTGCRGGGLYDDEARTTSGYGSEQRTTQGREAPEY